MFELMSADLREFSTGQRLDVFVLNSVTVTLQDNDGRLCNLLLFQLAFSLLIVNCSNKCSFPRQ